MAGLRQALCRQAEVAPGRTRSQKPASTPSSLSSKRSRNRARTPARCVGRASSSRARPAAVSSAFSPRRSVSTPRPLDRAREHEPIDEPRQPALGEDDGGGKIRHPQPPLGGVVENEEHLVLVRREIVRLAQLGIEAPDEISVRPQHAPPRRDLDGGQTPGSWLSLTADVCMRNYTT